MLPEVTCQPSADPAGSSDELNIPYGPDSTEVIDLSINPNVSIVTKYIPFGFFFFS